MLNTLEITNEYLAYPNPLIMVYDEFISLREKYNKDNKYNLEFTRLLAGIYHMVSLDSPYAGYSKDIKWEIIRKEILNNENIELSSTIKRAIRRYESLLDSEEMRLLSASLKFVHDSRVYLESFNFVENDPKKGIDMISKLSTLLDGIKEMRIKYSKNELGVGDIRAGIEINEFNK